jgi:hypothetical protein
MGLTDLNLPDMETCYKVFRREVIQSIPLEEDRFGFEPEITVNRQATSPFSTSESATPAVLTRKVKRGCKDGCAPCGAWRNTLFGRVAIQL